MRVNEKNGSVPTRTPLGEARPCEPAAERLNLSNRQQVRRRKTVPRAVVPAHDPSDVVRKGR